MKPYHELKGYLGRDYDPAVEWLPAELWVWYCQSVEAHRNRWTRLERRWASKHGELPLVSFRLIGFASEVDLESRTITVDYSGTVLAHEPIRENEKALESAWDPRAWK